MTVYVVLLLRRTDSVDSALGAGLHSLRIRDRLPGGTSPLASPPSASLLVGIADNEHLQAANVVYLGDRLCEVEFDTLRGNCWGLLG